MPENIDENLRQELLAMREDDNATRERLAKTGELFAGYNAEMEAVHLKNAKRVEEMIDEYGWLGKSKVGEDGADAAWLITQHAISLPQFSKKVLKILEECKKQIKFRAVTPLICPTVSRFLKIVRSVTEHKPIGMKTAKWKSGLWKMKKKLMNTALKLD